MIRYFLLLGGLMLLIILGISIFVFKNTHPRIFEFNGKRYQVSAKRFELIQKAQQGDERAQYELISEYYQVFPRPTQFIPEICFTFTEQLAQQEKDLGVITELGDLYFEGVGTAKDTAKAVALYKRALELYENPTPGLYIPQKSDEYKKFLQDTLKKYEMGNNINHAK